MTPPNAEHKGILVDVLQAQVALATVGTAFLQLYQLLSPENAVIVFVLLFFSNFAGLTAYWTIQELAYQPWGSLDPTDTFGSMTYLLLLINIMQFVLSSTVVSKLVTGGGL